MKRGLSTNLLMWVILTLVFFGLLAYYLYTQFFSG